MKSFIVLTTQVFGNDFVRIFFFQMDGKKFRIQNLDFFQIGVWRILEVEIFFSERQSMKDFGGRNFSEASVKLLWSFNVSQTGHTWPVKLEASMKLWHQVLIPCKKIQVWSFWKSLICQFDQQLSKIGGCWKKQRN